MLVWLLPAAYACHLVEEWIGDFPRWIAVATGSPLPSAAFVAINAVAFALFLAATRAATRHESGGWLAIVMATILFINAFAHIAGTLVFGSYSPGLVTGVVLYLPISQLVLIRAWYQADPNVFGRGMLAGAALHALLIPIVLTASR